MAHTVRRSARREGSTLAASAPVPSHSAQAWFTERNRRNLDPCSTIRLSRAADSLCTKTIQQPPGEPRLRVCRDPAPMPAVKTEGPYARDVPKGASGRAPGTSAGDGDEGVDEGLHASLDPLGVLGPVPGVPPDPQVGGAAGPGVDHHPDVVDLDRHRLAGSGDDGGLRRRVAEPEHRPR